MSGRSRPGDITLAHTGLGSRADLPIPFEALVVGSVLALAASFVVLAIAWRSPRYDGPEPGTTRMPPWRPGLVARIGVVVDHPVTRVVARLLGVAFFGYMLFALVAGPDFAINPGLGMFYVLLWVGIVPASLLLGRFYRAVSPVRAIHSVLALVTRSDPSRGPLDLPPWLGYWPAALGLYAFVWLELVAGEASVHTASVRLWLVVYLAVMVLGGALFGEEFFTRADPFEAYSTLVAHVSVWGRDADGTLVARSPLANLATLAPAPGSVAIVAVLFGSTAYDSFRESLVFLRFVNDHPDVDSTLIFNVALLAMVLAVGILVTLASRAMPVVGVPRRDVQARMAASIVPIIVGYVGAHYATYLLEFGQQVVIYMSDPLVDGSNLLGTADLKPAYFLSSNIVVLAAVQVGGVVLGHVLGAVAAHDRSLALLPRGRHVTGQLPMLALMVTLTAGGLYLLFAS